MAGFFNKVKDMMMLGDAYDEEEYEEYEEEEDEAPTREEAVVNNVSSLHQYSRRNSTNNKVVNFRTNVQMEVVVTYPESLEDACDICDDLKSKKTVVVNLEDVEHETAQRISDFLCGACFALDGSIQLISDEIFILGPANVELSGQFKDELRANGIKVPTSMWS